MSTRRGSASDLLQLLQTVEQPLYLLDDERRIVFVNNACARWLGVAAADLVGRTCNYRCGDADALVAAADALCPPPELFHGQAASAVLSKLDSAGQLERHRAEFNPLHGEDGRCVGVLAVVAQQALASGADGQCDANSTTNDEAQRLHEQVGRFKLQLAQRYRADRLAGSSPAMVRVRAQVDLAAGGTGTVLIVGPPGSGRQHVARTIHAMVNQSVGTLVPVSCASLPVELLQSTISALRLRQKHSDNSAPATLLLSEVHLLPAEMYHEMHHWLLSGPKNVRIIGTAPESLVDIAARREFPEDLAQLLSTLTIELPPLASRREDIPLLAQMFLEDFNAPGGKQLRGFTSDALDRLAQYDWPGQSDELAAMVREAFDQAEGYEVTSSDLPKQLLLAADAARLRRPPPQPIDLEKFLIRVERELIERALRQAKGNKSRAARLLGLNRPRLYRRMVQLGLEQDDSQRGEV